MFCAAVCRGFDRLLLKNGASEWNLGCKYVLISEQHCCFHIDVYRTMDVPGAHAMQQSG
jgi:hypothetical protein